ncbi:DNA-binding protein [Streptomyces sp. NPDC001840]|uniref:DNA-binding protein n=1 Tax=Streptomyces sp. NPDC059396 TaxID=3346819 RepID=UPI003675317A
MALRKEIENRMQALIRGTESLDEISEWALHVMEGDDPELLEPEVWRALDRLGGCDLMTGPGEYLHGPEDFRSWYEELTGTDSED